MLIRVHACGVNPVETYIRAGTYARKPTLPYTPGTDVAGVVETVGEGVTAVKVRLTNSVGMKDEYSFYFGHHMASWALSTAVMLVR